MTPGGFINKNQNKGMMASPKAELCYFGRNKKPCKYSIKKLKVTEVTPSNHPTVSEIAINTGFLDFEKIW